MNILVIIRPAAEDDVRESQQTYEAIRSGLGEKFLSQVRAVLERIEVMPNIYGVVWQDVRAARLKRFQHVVYYVVFENRAEVIAVVHGARSSSTWQSRA